MSEIKVNKLTPRVACGTVTLGDSGDTFTIPSGVTISNSGTAAGFGGTGEISWDTTVKTTGTFTATAGVGYFLNTTGGVITVNLPAGTAGDSVAMADYAATWQTSNVTVSANGSENIGGVAADVTLSTKGQSVTFVYIDGTQGWVNVLDSTSNVRGNAYMEATVSGSCNTLTDDGDYKVAKFINPGTFAVTGTAICAADNLVSYTVVAGGGGGGGSYGGGGGAGGYRELKSPSTPYTASPLDGYATPGNRITVTATPYPIGVGGGGAGGTFPSSPYVGTNGVNSTFSTITSAGGGGGATESGVGTAGGSGGGGSYGCSAGGAGNTPPTTPSQGFAGGTGGQVSPHYTNAGGGGALEAGEDSGPTDINGRGGVGTTTHITGSPVAYAGGGGAGGGDNPTTGGAGSPCGTGGAGSPAPGNGSPGTINTGGGGGAGTSGTGGGAGGSGIVIIRYRFQ
jgi:hypothetical protein